MNDNMSAEECGTVERWERGYLRSARSADRKVELARRAARNRFNKTKRINLRVTERDFSLAPRAGQGRRDSRSDIPVQRYPQAIVGAADREEVGRYPDTEAGDGGGLLTEVVADY